MEEQFCIGKVVDYRSVCTHMYNVMFTGRASKHPFTGQIQIESSGLFTLLYYMYVLIRMNSGRSRTSERVQTHMYIHVHVIHVVKH